jgi:hypothetical protein
VLAPGGVAVIEVPYLRDLIEHIEFDTIYHEHLCYFSVTALDRLFNSHGLTVFDVERIPIHGGSLRLFVAHDGMPRSTSAVEMLATEEKLGMTRAAYYMDFAARVDHLKRELLAFLTRLKAEGRSIAAYGASAKGATLLNFCGIGSTLLDFVADRSKVKQGKLTPGTRLQILSPDALVQSRPDYCLLLTWNFADEILQQQAAYRALGGKFIIPVPEVRVV